MKISYISKYRTQIMGAAMIWVMWFHSASYYEGILDFIHDIGFYGVDVFLLVSGLGLYFSLRKSKSIGEFYKKRAVRILPAYLIIAISWYCFYKTEVPISDKILSVSCINYWRGSIYGLKEYFDWFIPTLLVIYILTPFYFKAFEKAKGKWQFTALCSVISPILCVILFQFGKQPIYGAIVRIPVFLVGFHLGYFLYEKKEEHPSNWMALLATLIAGLILGYNIQRHLDNPTIHWGINCYAALLVAPGLSSLFGTIALYLEKTLKIVGKVILFPFYVCGRYSLEIYLLHQRFIEIIFDERYRQTFDFMFVNGSYRLPYWIAALLAIGVGALLHELISLCIKLFTKNSGKKEIETKASSKSKKSKLKKA